MNRLAELTSGAGALALGVGPGTLFPLEEHDEIP
jgi:hypothetical protein